MYACLTGDDGALAGMAPGCAIAVCRARPSGVELAVYAKIAASGFSTRLLLEAAGPQMRAPCWLWSAARRKSLNAPARYSRRLQHRTHGRCWPRLGYQDDEQLPAVGEWLRPDRGRASCGITGIDLPKLRNALMMSSVTVRRCGTGTA